MCAHCHRRPCHAQANNCKMSKHCGAAAAAVTSSTRRGSLSTFQHQGGATPRSRRLQLILAVLVAGLPTLQSQAALGEPESRKLIEVTPGFVVAWGSQDSVPTPLITQYPRVHAIAAGRTHSLAVLWGAVQRIDLIIPTYTVVAWPTDRDLYGETKVPQEAVGTVSQPTSPSDPAFVWLDVCGGEGYSLALKSDGSVLAWGSTWLGGIEYTRPNVTLPPFVAENIIAIACGEWHSLALTRDGSVIGWGRNTTGQASVPATALGGVQAIAAGNSYSLALLTNGTLIGWGTNFTVPSYAQQNVRNISARGDNVLALLNSGAVVSFTGNDQVPLAAKTNVTAIAAGESHSLALLENGTVVAWGSNQYGQTTPIFLAQAGVKAIAAGDRHSLALVNPYAAPKFASLSLQPNGLSGSVIGWGLNVDNQATAPNAVLTNVQAIAAGQSHSLALVAGQVVAWGWNDDEQSKIPVDARSGVVAICGGWNHSLALKDTGRVLAWGANGQQQASVPMAVQTGVVAIACGDFHNLGLLENGAVVAWGRATDGQASVPTAALSGVQAIAAGSSFSLALLTNGTLIGWGQLSGSGFTVPSYAQQNVAAISARGDNVLALLTNGAVVSFTGNDQVPLAARTNVKAIAAGASHSLALLENGTVVSWGSNAAGQITPQTAFAQAIAAGGSHSLAIVTAAPPLPPSLAPPPPPPPAPLQSPRPAVSPVSPSPPAGASSLLPLPVVSPAGAEGTGGSGGSAPVGAIVGGIVGGGVVLLALIFGTWLLRRRRSRASNNPPVADPKDQAPHADGHGVIVIDVAQGKTSKPNVENSPVTTATTLTTSSSAVRASRTSSQAGPLTPQLSQEAPSAANITAAMQMRVLDSLLIQWSELKIGRILGTGGFGQVYQSVWQGLPVAVKTLDLTKLGAGSRDALHQEALIMCDLRYPYIAKVLGLVDDHEHQALVMQLYRRGTLATLMTEAAYEDLGLEGRLKVALQVAMGMRFLHSRTPTILHGDLKSTNVLVSDDGKTMAISDFGLSGKLLSGALGKVVESGALTVAISPPEVLLDPVAPRTGAVDVYMFGVLLLEILLGRAAYPRHMRPHEIRHAVLQGYRPPIPDHVPEAVVRVITACWAQEAQTRPAFSEVVAWLEALLPDPSVTTTTATTTSDWVRQ